MNAIGTAMVVVTTFWSSTMTTDAIPFPSALRDANVKRSSLASGQHESLILGDDIIGQALRCVKGIEVTEETLALEAMRQVCIGGPGHYLGVGDTLARMETDYAYPRFGDRTSPKEWAEKGRPDLVANARARKEAILSEPSRAALDPLRDQEIRHRFPIRLPF